MVLGSWKVGSSTCKEIMIVRVGSNDHMKSTLGNCYSFSSVWFFVAQKKQGIMAKTTAKD